MSAPETCKRGHPWTPENTYQRPNGRFCRECQRIRRAARIEALRGKPCLGCGREGLVLDLGSKCARCVKRRRQGIPLDAPPIHGGGKDAPDAGTPRPPKGSKLPKGWYDTKPAGREKPRGDAAMILRDTLDVAGACLRLLTRHDCLDLAVMLGVADEEPTPVEPEPPREDHTAAGRMAVLAARRATSDAWLVDVDAAVAELGDDGRAVAARLGYSYGDMATRLRRLGRHELAARLRPARGRRAS